MEAWILHIHEEFPGDGYQRDKYSSWATEKQAIKAAGEFIKGLTHSEIELVLLPSLYELVDQDKIDLAIQLINNYSRFNIQNPTKETNLYKYNIKIVKSTFQGSPFE